MGYCKDCRRWQSNTPPDVQSSDGEYWGVCGRIDTEDGPLACVDTWGDGDDETGGELRTAPLFGCVEFEPGRIWPRPQAPIVERASAGVIATPTLDEVREREAALRASLPPDGRMPAGVLAAEMLAEHAAAVAEARKWRLCVACRQRYQWRDAGQRYCSPRCRRRAMRRRQWSGADGSGPRVSVVEACWR